VDLAEVPMVGDTARDLQAAHAAGCEAHLVQSGRARDLDDTQLLALLAQSGGARVHASLGAFADFLLERDQSADSAVGGLN
jgi:D-glycero-D-manno-heptose 1,7-bisphosphate phosphatase